MGSRVPKGSSSGITRPCRLAVESQGTSNSTRPIPLTITACRQAELRRKSAGRSASMAVADAERRRAGVSASVISSNSGSTRFGCSRFIRARSRRGPAGSGLGSPLRRQELLRGNAADGLGVHPGRDARIPGHAARPRRGPRRVPGFHARRKRFRTITVASWTPRSITLRTTRSSRFGRTGLLGQRRRFRFFFFFCHAHRFFWNFVTSGGARLFPARRVRPAMQIARMISPPRRTGTISASGWTCRTSISGVTRRSSQTRASKNNYTNEGDLVRLQRRGRERRGPGQRPLRPRSRRTCGAISGDLSAVLAYPVRLSG